MNEVARVDLYAYYPSNAGADSALRAAFAALARPVAQRFGVLATLHRRLDDVPGQQTWMEIYPGVIRSDLPELERDIARLSESTGLHALLLKPRKLERFAPADAIAAIDP